MLRFKDMFPYGIEYRPGEDELVNYRVLRRRRTLSVGEGGPVSEAVEDDVDEALSVQQRLKRARDLRKNRAKIALGRRRAARRMASMEVLRKRARKAAYKTLYKKITKDIPKDQLSPARKAEIEKRLAKPALQARIDRMAKKMLKDVRKRELERKRGGSK